MATTITATTPQPPLQVQDGDVVTFRGWYTNDFVGSDGVTPVEGGNGQSGFYYSYGCTINEAGNVVIPEIVIQPTTGSNPTAGFFGAIFVNGAFERMIFGVPQATAGWQIPTSPATTTFGALALYNAAVQLLYPPVTYATYEQVLLAIAEFAGNFFYAAVGINGIGQPSVAPAVASEPIFFGINDPAVGDLHGTLTENTVPRASAEKTLVDGLASDDGVNWGVQTTQYAQLGDYGAAQNHSFIDVNDNLGRANLFAGAEEQAQYAGIAALAEIGNAEVFVQTTDFTNVYANKSITRIGDAQDNANSTQVKVDDSNQMVVQSTRNAAPADVEISNEESCFYLDESGNALKVRVRYSDGTYKTGTIALV